MEEWSESVKLAVDVLVAILIVCALLVVSSISRSIMGTVDEQRSLNDDIAEFRVQQTYNNASCYAQDIVSVVIEYQGTPMVTVDSGAGTVLTWSKDSYATPLTASAISAAINQGIKYKCTLAFDSNGSVKAFNFVKEV